MGATRGSADGPAGGECPFCGLAYLGAPAECRLCGTLLGEAAEEAERLEVAARRRVRIRKALSDTFFLVGLLLGGTMITLGGELRLGLFIVLAGGLTSVLQRYTTLSSVANAMTGCLFAALIATLIVEPAETAAEGVMAGEAARTAFVFALAEQDPEIVAEARGPGSLTVWFTVPTALAGECGGYPEPETREHLAGLGFLRVVVRDRSPTGGLCSFRP